MTSSVLTFYCSEWDTEHAEAHAKELDRHKDREAKMLEFELTMQERNRRRTEKVRNLHEDDVFAGIDDFEKNLQRMGVDPRGVFFVPLLCALVSFSLHQSQLALVCAQARKAVCN